MKNLQPFTLYPFGLIHLSPSFGLPSLCGKSPSGEAKAIERGKEVFARACPGCLKRADLT